MNAVGGMTGGDPAQIRALANQLAKASTALCGIRSRVAPLMVSAWRGPWKVLEEPLQEALRLADETGKRFDAAQADLVVRAKRLEEAGRDTGGGTVPMALAAGLSGSTPFARLVSGAARGAPLRAAPMPATNTPGPAKPSFVTSPTRLEKGRKLPPGKRFYILKGFFSRYGGEKHGLGYGEALETFMKWERKSGRLDPKLGHPWWRAVNGSMMVDIAEAERRLAQDPKARSENPAVQAWIAFATSKNDRQKKLWTAHQVSLHSAIRAADREGLYDKLPLNEQRFVEQVVENVDLTALGNMSSGSIGKRDLSGTIATVGMEEYLDRVYPDGSVATEADLERVEDWATPGLLMDPRAIKYLQTGGVIGIESNKW